ncbi:hypothetical protein [Polymorphobacter megasporae]|uniref:hypothetical protein n=1 Tax=Glacieibacterium megasporae TaxID=2835787 RepID=UPI001C1E32C0|nr:hypothetical protein [Polymorphobacter megasporae]UAJ10708.1 hypothetical protein KTC28_02895 [Polymorphobacter megasporae]
MKTKIILAAIAAAAITSTAVAKPMHHRMASHASSGSEATKALNEKSLAQASGGGSMGAPMAPRNGAMSDSGAAAPMATPDAAPMGSPAGNAMTPPATPAPQQ